MRLIAPFALFGAIRFAIAPYVWEGDALVVRMREFGFTTCIYDPIARCLTAAPAGRTGSSRRNTLRYCALRRFAAGSGNTLFVRDPAGMQPRLSGARRFRLVNGSI